MVIHPANQKVGRTGVRPPHNLSLAAVVSGAGYLNNICQTPGTRFLGRVTPTLFSWLFRLHKNAVSGTSEGVPRQDARAVLRIDVPVGNGRSTRRLDGLRMSWQEGILGAFASGLGLERIFVRQHDFATRIPGAPGLGFWADPVGRDRGCISSTGHADREGQADGPPR